MYSEITGQQNNWSTMYLDKDGPVKLDPHSWNYIVKRDSSLDEPEPQSQNELGEE
jgi:hypothetical protein